MESIISTHGIPNKFKASISSYRARHIGIKDKTRFYNNLAAGTWVEQRVD